MRGAALQQRQAVCGASLPPPRAPARRRSAPAPPPHAAKSRRNPPRPKKAAAAGETEQLRVDLGGGKALELLRAAEVFDFGAARTASVETLQAHYGAGDVVWPASVALARLVAHCPSFAARKRVVELGAGLGLPGCAAAQAGAASLLLADRDTAALALAARSAALNAPALAAEGLVSTLAADWGGDLAAWPPPGAVDLVLASDVLYDATAPAAVAALLARLLAPAPGAAAPEAPPRALFADPPQRLHREAFVAACAAQGLTAQVGPLPGPENMTLIAVVRAAADA